MSWLLLLGGDGTSVTVPAAPAGFTGVSNDSTSVLLSWLAPTGTVTGYEYRVDGGSAVSVGSVLSTIVNGLTTDTAYDFEVRALSPYGASPWSTTITVTPTGSSALAKPAPNLDTTGAVTVGTGSNIQSLIDANAAGTVFYFPNGTYTNVQNLRPKQGNRFIGESEAGVIIQGGGASEEIAFRTRQNDITWARMTFQGFGTPDTTGDQNVGVIDLHDNAAENATASTFVSWWPKFNKSEDSHIAECTFRNNGNLGIYTGIRTNITDCTFIKHSPQAIGGGGGFGGMIHSCEFDECGIFGAPGAGSNRAAIKIVNHNAGPWGDTSKDMTPHFARRGGTQPSDSPVETLNIVNCLFDGKNNSNILRGIWFDIDVRYADVSYNTFQNINGAGVFYEGCNGGWVHHNTFTNCGNLGAINFSGGFNTSFTQKYMAWAAVNTGASHNILVEDNTFDDCEVSLLFYNGARYETPSDWLQEYPVITWGEMASGFGVIAPGDRSNGGSSTCTSRNNTFTGTSEHFGFWTTSNVTDNPGADNAGTFVFSGNTYPASANNFVFNRTFQTQAQWTAAGRG